MKTWILPTIILSIAIIVFLLLRWSSVEKQVAQPATTPEAEPTSVQPRRTYSAFPGVLPPEDLALRKATIVTVKGNVVLALFGDEAPKAVSNFVTLSRYGFYNGLTFHRREEGFVIQGGDPNGTGTGGPGYQFDNEPVRRAYTRGIVAMANAGVNTNGSQFFIMLRDTPLPPLYTIFGEVVSGMDVVDRILVGDRMERITIE